MNGKKEKQNEDEIKEMKDFLILYRRVREEIEQKIIYNEKINERKNCKNN